MNNKCSIVDYSYVFEDDGKVYMLPETGEDKSISLYEQKMKH